MCITHLYDSSSTCGSKSASAAAKRIGIALNSHFQTSSVLSLQRHSQKTIFYLTLSLKMCKGKSIHEKSMCTNTHTHKAAPHRLLRKVITIIIIRGMHLCMQQCYTCLHDQMKSKQSQNTTHTLTKSQLYSCNNGKKLSWTQMDILKNSYLPQASFSTINAFIVFCIPQIMQSVITGKFFIVLFCSLVCADTQIKYGVPQQFF